MVLFHVELRRKRHPVQIPSILSHLICAVVVIFVAVFLFVCAAVFVYVFFICVYLVCYNSFVG